MELPFTLIIGQRYLLFAENSEWQTILRINTSDALVQTEDNNYVLIPYVEKPTLQVHRNVSMDICLRLKISKCPAENILPNTNQLNISWTFPHTAASFEDIVCSVSLLKYVSVNSSDEESIFAPPQTLVGLSDITFHDMNFEAQTLYMASVQLCNNVRCLSPIHSQAFTIELEAPDISFINIEVIVANAGECVDVKASWKIIGQSANVAFYQWSVSRDEIGGQLLSVWENVLPNGTTVKVEKCVRLPTHGHMTTFMCVRVFSVSGLAKTSCHKINKGNSGSYSKTAVYDFDSSSDTWVFIKKMLSSSDIGQHYVLLHDSEMNIGNADSSVTGALMYGSERSVSWYLMKMQYVPQTCDSDINCVLKYETDNGYIELDRKYISLNELYFICAYSNYTVIEREYFTEILEEISSCSNGFILDSSPPTKGEVQVHNHRGFITNPHYVIVTWTGFDDNIDATVFGYPEKLHYFSLRTGTVSGSSNLLEIVRTGIETSAILDLSTPPDGSQVFFTINATDYASLSTSSDSLELIIDTSPPLCGSVTILNNHQRNIFINQEQATVRFEGFSDPHSGLDYFNVGVGTIEGVTDIMSDTKVSIDFLELNLAQMIDGHHYFIIVQAINRAGLVSQSVSKRFVLDRTAPTGGHVVDGINGAGEIDYQNDIYVINAYWKEFYDPESGLAFFKVGLGTDPYETDVRPLKDVGMMTEVSWNGPFVLGQKYFVTVEACNNANLCIRRVSDGLIVDNSPPVRGLVHVGPGEGHDKYLGHRSSIRISWQGFEDPQSDIDHFEVCVSTSKGDCDVVVLSNRLLHSSIIISNITLPINISLMATVWAFNGVGMNVSKASDIFVIDDTPPVVVKAPKFLLKYNSENGKTSQWEKSILRVEWKFKDDISPIVRHEISLKTHHEGHTPVERLVLGSECHVTVSLDGRNWLNNGDTYFAIVTSCNAAGLCASERTSDLLIDSTPPHLGGFKPPLAWTNYNNTIGSKGTNLSLTWYGFHDQESGIENYYVTVSRSYSFNELSNGVIRIRETNQSEIVQTSFVLTESISPDESIILSIWAQNNVGLNSSIARVTVNVLSETSRNEMGILEIEKHSCDIHFCNKDCTCAVIDRPCVEVSSNVTCTTISSTDAHTQNVPQFDVYWGQPHEMLNFSASSACLSGHWSRTIGVSTSENIHRFEWSLGVHGHAVGEGVYDLKLENPWNDVGQRLQFIHCLPVNRSFVHGERYVIYVKVWYSKSTYSVFKSSPIIIDQRPPKVRRGRYIREGNCFQDLDFIDWTDNIIACWDDVFTEEHSLIDHFSVSLGTSPHNDDILQQIDVGLETNISLHNISLNPGTRYYFTVIAVNSVGLHTGLASDGFIIDTDIPIHGVVFNTIGHKNADFQKSTSTFELSWHGFQDHFSGIEHYLIALAKDGEYNESNLTFTNVGLSIKYAFTNLNLVNGESYFGIVKAVDAAGHESESVRCPKQTIDTTPPKGFSCGSTKTIEIDVYRKFTDESLYLWFNANISKDNMYVIHGKIKNATYVLNPILQMDKYSLPLPVQKHHDGWFEYNYMFISPLEGLQTITIDFGNTLAEHLIQNFEFEVCNRVENNSAAISVNQIGQYLLTVSLGILDSESELQTVSVGAGTTEGGFQIKPLFELHNRNSFGVIFAPFIHGAPIFITAIAKNHAGLTSVFFSGKALTIDHTPPIVSDIAVAVSVITDNSTKLLTTWTARDDESDVQYCSCLIGSNPLSADIQEEKDSDTLQFCQSDILNLSHGDRVFVTVKCVNKVEIATTLVSRQVIIYLEPPNNAHAFVRFLPSGQESFSMTGQLSAQYFAQSNSSILQMEWNNFEDPSEITSYSYRIQSNGEIVVDWTDAGLKDMLSNKHLKLKSGQTYTTEVHAVNGGGFTSFGVTSSLIVASEPPALTGSHISAVVANGKLTLNWESVFTRIPGVPVHYSLVIGSRDGFSDIADVNYTGNHVYDVIVPSSTLVSPNLNELYIKLRCTYSTGLFTTYSSSYKL